MWQCQCYYMWIGFSDFALGVCVLIGIVGLGCMDGMFIGV